MRCTHPLESMSSGYVERKGVTIRFFKCTACGYHAEAVRKAKGFGKVKVINKGKRAA